MLVPCSLDLPYCIYNCKCNNIHTGLLHLASEAAIDIVFENIQTRLSECIGQDDCGPGDRACNSSRPVVWHIPRGGNIAWWGTFPQLCVLSLLAIVLHKGWTAPRVGIILINVIKL